MSLTGYDQHLLTGGSVLVKRLKILIKLLLCVLVLVLLSLILTMRRVTTEEMAWTLRPGDWVWSFDMEPIVGDVVQLADPLDPGRMVLRRVIAGPEDRVRYEDGSIRVNGKRIRQTDMGRQPLADGEDRMRIYKEVIWSRPPARPTNWLIVRMLKPVQWKTDGRVLVPEGHWFLLADNRDQAMDSRVWGPVPQSSIEGVVRMRLGPEDTWRPRWQWLKPIE